MGNATWDGVVYAASERHRELSLERRDGTRFIVQPELWNWDEAREWVEGRKTLVATGLEAAGLPVLMRATVTEIEPFPTPAPDALTVARARIDTLEAEKAAAALALGETTQQLDAYASKVFVMGKGHQHWDEVQERINANRLLLVELWRVAPAAKSAEGGEASG